MQLLKLTAAVSVLFLMSCQKEVSLESNSTKIQLSISNTVNGSPLSFGVPYTNSFGEDFTVSKLKYYISNIALIDSNGRLHKAPDSYFLFDQGNPSSMNISFSDDISAYKGIQFLIGVDSVRNVSGAQTGALDPTNEMFWTWNSGYIMAKLEGSSSLSTLPDNRIEYHIGGFEGPDKVLRTISFEFDQVYHLSLNKTLTVNLNAELQNWFNGVHNLPIQNNASCTTPGSLASEYSDNYSTMFSLGAVTYQ
jgi:hypothetical protein